MPRFKVKHRTLSVKGKLRLALNLFLSLHLALQAYKQVLMFLERDPITERSSERDSLCAYSISMK